MKDVFSMYTQYNKERDKTVLSLLAGLSNDDREKERGSYYGSLTGLLRHLLDVVPFFLGMFKDAVAQNPEAIKALAPLDAISVPKGKLTEAQWKQIETDFETADSVFVKFVSALKPEDFKAPVKVAWFKGNPESVPLFYMLSQFVTHQTHHRGQISQILDELKIDNDYSGLSPAFLDT
jgi:uncharacterized damage-inducible protein DinB